MAVWPANGATDWNTKSRAFIDIEHDGTTGKHLVDTKYAPVDSVTTRIFTKYFTGTTDSDTSTSVSHGVTGIDNILSVQVSIFDSGTGVYRSPGWLAVVNTDKSITVSYSATSIIMSSMGADLQGQKYRIKIEYVV